VSGRSIQLTRTNAKDLDRLAPALRDQLVRNLRDLQTDPTGRAPRIKRLRGYGAPLYRLRSGDYPIVYRLDDELITVLRVINRRDLDRALRRLGL
jgi:mRNA-degrading endonuclease RelE of RelBE toxin-antitoxin system